MEPEMKNEIPECKDPFHRAPKKTLKLCTLCPTQYDGYPWQHFCPVCSQKRILERSRKQTAARKEERRKFSVRREPPTERKVDHNFLEAPDHPIQEGRCPRCSTPLSKQRLPCAYEYEKGEAVRPQEEWFCYKCGFRGK